LLVLSLLWLGGRPSRERRIAGPLLAVAVAMLAAGWVLQLGERESRAEWLRETRQEYAHLWQDLRGEAAAAAAAVGRPSETPAARLAAFSRLAEIEIGKEKGRRALLLLDPDGVPVAWAGEGLLHELSQEVPRSGLQYRASFSAVTLLAIQPLDDARRPWRIIAGASFPTDALPFVSGRRARWTLAESPVQALPGADVVTLPGAPALVVARLPLAAQPSPWPPVDRLAWAMIGVTLLSIAVLRFLGRALAGGAPPQADDRPAHPVSLLAAGGLIALGAAALVPGRALGVLLAGLVIAAAGMWSRSHDGDRVPPWLKGAGIILLLFLAAWGMQRSWGPLDLAGGILASAEAVALRLGFTAAAFRSE